LSRRRKSSKPGVTHTAASPSSLKSWRNVGCSRIGPSSPARPGVAIATVLGRASRFLQIRARGAARHSELDPTPRGGGVDQ
jgi:hypothetical protein